MGVDTVYSAVIEDAKKVAKQHDIKLEENRITKMSEINETLEKLKQKKKDLLKEKISLLAKTETSRTNLEIKRKRLRMEHDILEEVLAEVKNKLYKIDQEKREKILVKLASVATLQYFYSNEMDEEYVKIIAKDKYKGNISCLGGILTEDISGKIREDFTFDSILISIFNNNLKELRDILFGEAEHEFQCNIT
jgi:V/A-type H+-transporting ATPase subunit E